MKAENTVRLVLKRDRKGHKCYAWLIADVEGFGAVTVTAVDLIVWTVVVTGVVDGLTGLLTALVTVDVTVVLTELAPFWMTVFAWWVTVLWIQIHTVSRLFSWLRRFCCFYRCRHFVGRLRNRVSAFRTSPGQWGTTFRTSWTSWSRTRLLSHFLIEFILSLRIPPLYAKNGLNRCF